jgi:hypothetical protein
MAARTNRRSATWVSSPRTLVSGAAQRVRVAAETGRELHELSTGETTFGLVDPAEGELLAQAVDILAVHHRSARARARRVPDGDLHLATGLARYAGPVLGGECRTGYIAKQHLSEADAVPPGLERSPESRAVGRPAVGA